MIISYIDKCVVCDKDFEVYYIFGYEDKICKGCLLKDINCNGHMKKLCNNRECKGCFYRSFASSKKWKYLLNRNDRENVRKIFKGFNGKLYFLCHKCNHILIIKVCSIFYNGNFCAYCENKKLCKKEDNCSYCISKSLASCASKIVEAYKKGNNEVPPEEVFRGSSLKRNFECNNCGHTFLASPHNLTKSRWCPYCCYPCRKLCKKEKNCGYCISKSLASLDAKIIEAYKNGNNKLPPEEILKGSDIKAEFLCYTCNHMFNLRICMILKGFCAYCVNRKICKKEKNCSYCISKSLASLDFKIIEAYKNGCNLLPPEEVFKGSEQKLNFRCYNCDHIYASCIFNVCKGVWCPCTKNKTETKLFEWLQTTFPNLFTKQKTYEYLKDVKCLPFDFCYNNIHIELDGEQHFKQVLNWKTPEETLRKDLIKQKYIKDNKLYLIRLYQPDVWRDKYDWKTLLKNSINNIINGNKTEHIIFLLNSDNRNEEYNNIYNKHK